MKRIKTLLLFLYFSFCLMEGHVTANVTVSTVNNDIIPFVNERLKIYLNKLFYYLQINKKFRRSYKTRLLLIMYENVNNAIEFNWKTFSEMKNSVAMSDHIQNNYFYKLVTDVLKSTELVHNNKTGKNIITFASTKDEQIVNAAHDKKSIFNTTKLYSRKDTPPTNMLDKLMNTINNLTAEDLIYHPVNKTYLEINAAKRYKIFRRKNFDLKTWDPNEYSDDKLSITRRMARADLVTKFPFIASIHVMERFTCTGSIISKNAILTAASCLPFSYDAKMIQQMPDIIQVRVGSDYANHYGENVPIVDVEFHPKYDTKTLKNNLAIIRLAKLQKYARSRPKIRKIRLDRSPGGPKSDLRHVQILGFGAGNEDLKGDNQQLVAVNLDLMPLKQCKDIYSGQFVNEMDFCAGFKASRRNSHCNGDVGAPGVADGHLVGIVSFGPPVCGRHDAPTVFIKIGIYSQWIDQILNQTFKIPYPGENVGSREFKSTRMFLEEDENTSLRTTSRTPSPHAKKHHVFKEIKSILTRMSNPTEHHRYTRKLRLKLADENVNKKIENGEDDPYKMVHEGTETTSAIHHPLINKSIVPIPGIHYPVVTTTYRTTTKAQRPDIGLPEKLPYDYIEDAIKTSEDFDYFIKRILKEYGKDGLDKLPWQKRVRLPKVFITKNWHGDDTKDFKENAKESHELKIEIIPKTIQKYRKNNINSQLRKNANIHKSATVSTPMKARELNIFRRYGYSKIIGHKITRPYGTM